MTQTVSNSQFTGPSKGLTIVDKLAYAFSGGVAVDNSEDYEVLAFTTGDNPIAMEAYPAHSSNNDTGTSDDMIFKFNLNENMINIIVSNNVTDPKVSLVYKFVIPPLSYVKITAVNGDSSTNKAFMTLIGKVHDN